MSNDQRAPNEHAVEDGDPGADVAFSAAETAALQQVRLGPRPKKKALTRLRDAGVTHLVTLLSAREGAETLGQAAKTAGLRWLWAPMEGARLDRLSSAHVLADVDAVATALTPDRTMIALIHCAAGQHRTGLFGYALLRRLGFSPETARAGLKHLREITWREVGAERLAWVEAALVKWDGAS